ncbi:Solute carrier organic anion transporter family member 4C1 [Thelohanellus kitauei]|uniref:Solute carrier organic anion transporter family member 4C1 n=1 Tax=Thelohanellus kitauei TaxID=669202 RepID=A0A0C2J210_THEKT|nr:Solute carrier organic anion transporter family member 4C1 [Thelohanellus kitauei]
MPVFIVSRQTIDVQAKSYLCMENTSVPHAKEGTHQQLSLTLMYIGYALIGIGSAPLFTIAINYILETFDESQTPLFTTIYYTCQVLGIVFVFILGKIALNIPMFPWKEQDSQLTPDQDNWVGAYWVIYLIGFFIMLFLLIANLIVSQYIKYKSKTVNLPPKQDKTTKRSFSNLFSSVLGVVKNVKLFLMIISYACVNLAENSIANYLQMYLEVQFQMSPDNAAIWGGVPAIFSTVIGLYLSSLLMKKYCSDNQKLFLIHMTAATLSVVCLVASSFYCEQEKIHGLKQDQAVISGFDTAYYDSCGCSVEDYFPVCLNGKSTYYSPCILGCKNVSNNHGGKTFTDCFNSQPHPEYKLTEGNCPKKCFKLVPFLILGNLSIFFICLSSMTSLQSEINLSEGDSFDLALGIKAVLCRILQIIGPVLYGLLFDFSCSIKRPLVGGDITSNCIEYDQKKMTMIYIGVSAFFAMFDVVGPAYNYFRK